MDKKNIVIATVVVLTTALLVLGLPALALTAYFHYVEKDQRYAKEQLEPHLKDGSSARFRDLKWHGETLCGKLNSKNSYGGYTGYSRFTIERLPSINKSIVLLEDSRSDGSEDRYFAKNWKDSCVN